MKNKKVQEIHGRSTQKRKTEISDDLSGLEKKHVQANKNFIRSEKGKSRFPKKNQLSGIFSP